MSHEIILAVDSAESAVRLTGMLDQAEAGTSIVFPLNRTQDARERYDVEIGQYFELVLRVLNAGIAALTLKRLAHDELRRHHNRKRPLDQRRPPSLILIVDGQEHNLSEMSEEEVKSLLER